MKVRLTTCSLRIRLDDLELARLQSGETLSVAAEWPGGGWTLVLDPLRSGLSGEGGLLRVGISGLIDTLGDPLREGVTLEGPPRVVVEKDFGPQHA